MRILYICPSSGMYGDNIALSNILPRLKEYGVEPLVVVPIIGEFTSKLDDLKIPYVVIPASVPNIWYQYIDLRSLLGYIKRRITIYPRNYRKLIRIVKAFRPDIIHSNNTVTGIGYKLSKELNIPHLWHIREYGDLDHGYHFFPTKRAFINRINDKLNYSVCITKDIYDYFNSSDKGAFVYDGVINSHSTLPIIKDKDQGYFLYVGRLVQTKGIESVLNSFIDLYKKGKLTNDLLIAGSGYPEYEAKLKRMSLEFEVQKRIKFLGYRSDIATLMSNARALIVPSRFEAFGFISVEAMYNGCPVIGHDVAGTKCQFDNGISYCNQEIGFRYNNIEELKQNILLLANTNRSTLKSMLQDAQKTVLYYYSIERSAFEVKSIYEKIINLNKNDK